MRNLPENKKYKLFVNHIKFFDLNEILGLGIASHGDDFKVVIIDMFPSYINSYISWFQHLIHGCNPQEYTFISRLAKDRLSVEIGQEDFPLFVGEYGIPVVSRNGKLMMCINGFKNAVVNHKETILGFLGV